MNTANTEMIDRTAGLESAEPLAPAADLTLVERELLAPRGKKEKKGRKNSLKRGENIVGWLYISPMVIGFLVFTLIPLVMSIMAMFYDWNGVDDLFGEFTRYVGLQNFKAIFGGLDSAMYWRALGNTLLFAIQLPVGMILGLFLALGMNRKMRSANTFRVIYYLPGVMSIVAVTIVWQNLFANDGTINNLLGTNMKWLTSDIGVITVVNLLLIWKGIGYTSLMFIAGLQSVSTDQLEAARIDGASNWKILIKIMLPALYPTIFYLFVTGLMGSMQMFNEPYILVGGYGQGSVTTGYNAMTVVSYVYYAKGKSQFGLASVGAWVLAIIIFIITAIQLYVDKRREKDY